MSPPLRPRRFFQVVLVMPRGIVMAILGATIVGCAVIAVMPEAAQRVLTPLIGLHVLGSASGFRVPAARGHYDLLLTGGASRASIAWGHLMASLAPGCVGWSALALTERLTGHDTLTSSHSLAMVVLVPGLAWALTVPFPRLTGAIVLLLAYQVAGEWGAQVLAAAPPWAWGVMTLVTGASVGAGVWWASRVDVPLEQGQ